MLERNSYVRIRLKIAATDGFKEELCASDNVVFACWKKRDREEELHKANRITMNTSMHPTTLDFSFEISFLEFLISYDIFQPYDPNFSSQESTL